MWHYYHYLALLLTGQYSISGLHHQHHWLGGWYDHWSCFLLSAVESGSEWPPVSPWTDLSVIWAPLTWTVDCHWDPELSTVIQGQRGQAATAFFKWTPLLDPIPVIKDQRGQAVVFSFLKGYSIEWQWFGVRIHWWNLKDLHRAQTGLCRPSSRGSTSVRAPGGGAQC